MTPTSSTSRTNFRSELETARRIVCDGDDIRFRIRDLVIDAVHEHRLTLKRIPDLANQVVEGALEGTQTAGTETGLRMFRQTIEGVADAISTVATSLELAFAEARGTSTEFSPSETHRAIETLHGIEPSFVGAIMDGMQSARGASIASTSEVADYVHHGAQRIRQQAQAALRAAGRHEDAPHPASTADSESELVDAMCRLLDIASGVAPKDINDDDNGENHHRLSSA